MQMQMLSPEIKSDFPIFSAKENKDLIYLDSAATSQEPESVINAISDFYRKNNANTLRGAYSLGDRATELYENSRNKVAKFINAENSKNIIFTRGTTESINAVARGWGDKFVQRGDQIALTETEHHSNLIPWQELARRKEAQLIFLPYDENSVIDYNRAANFVSRKTKIIAITHASNVLGTDVDIKKVAEIAKSCGAKLLIDGAQYVPHKKLDVSELGVDFYCFSGHKMLAPSGIGVLYGKSERLQEMSPVNFGGSMIAEVEPTKSTWADLPWKFEGGTQNAGGAIALGSAIDYLEKIGLDKIDEHCKELTKYALQKIVEVDNLTIHGPKNFEQKNPVISFEMKGLHPHDLSTFLDSKGIAIRAGHHCAKLLMQKLGTSATSRASFYLYNTSEEIDYFVEQLANAIKFFKI